MSSSPPRAASAWKRLAVMGVLRSSFSRFRMSSPCPAAIRASARARSDAVSCTYFSRNSRSLTWPRQAGGQAPAASAGQAAPRRPPAAPLASACSRAARWEHGALLRRCQGWSLHGGRSMESGWRSERADHTGACRMAPSSGAACGSTPYPRCTYRTVSWHPVEWPIMTMPCGEHGTRTSACQAACSGPGQDLAASWPWHTTFMQRKAAHSPFTTLSVPSTWG